MVPRCPRGSLGGGASHKHNTNGSKGRLIINCTPRQDSLDDARVRQTRQPTAERAGSFSDAVGSKSRSRTNHKGGGASASHDRFHRKLGRLWTMEATPLPRRALLSKLGLAREGRRRGGGVFARGSDTRAVSRFWVCTVCKPTINPFHGILPILTLNPSSHHFRFITARAPARLCPLAEFGGCHAARQPACADTLAS